MKKELESIPREQKIEFLKKLASGRYRLLDSVEPQPKLNFDLESDGLYVCREDRRMMTAKEIKNLPGYMLVIERVSTRAQVNHQSPAEGYVLVPFSKQDLLSGILVSIDNEKDVIGGDFVDALKSLTTEELKHLHKQLEMEAKNQNKWGCESSLNEP